MERKLVAQPARQDGISLRPPQAPRRHEEIDRDWLYTEYVVHRRALPELAAEKGMSTMNISRWAKTHGIPLRGRGGPSHTVNGAKVWTNCYHVYPAHAAFGATTSPVSDGRTTR